MAPPKQEKKMVIDMNAMNLKKEHAVPAFRTGRHMTEKDRPRKKNWKREYERGKEPGRYRDDISFGSFDMAAFVIEYKHQGRKNDMKKKTVLLIAFAISFLMVLAGCGSRPVDKGCISARSRCRSRQYGRI